MSPLSPSAPAYSWTLLRAGAFRLDAGSMFGLIPRTVWSRAVPTDDRGRMSVQHNCLLLESGGKRLLIETGTGDKLDPRSRDIFALEDRSILTALAEINPNPGDIHGVAVSHLHFDHAGGLTRLCRDGEAPDWTGPAGGMAGTRPDHSVKRTFPSATLFVQQQEWQDARLNRSVMTRTYFQDHLEPLADRLHLLHAPPFTPHDNPSAINALPCPSKSASFLSRVSPASGPFSRRVTPGASRPSSSETPHTRPSSSSPMFCPPSRTRGRPTASPTTLSPTPPASPSTGF